MNPAVPRNPRNANVICLNVKGDQYKYWGHQLRRFKGTHSSHSKPIKPCRERRLVIRKKKKQGSFKFVFWGGMWKIQVKKLIITQKPHHSFVIVWFDSGFFGFKLSWSFPTWKREKRDHLSTLWQKILQREQLNPWTTESTLPQTYTSPSLSWNHGPKHKSAKQCHKNLLHFDLSQKAEKRGSFKFVFTVNIFMAPSAKEAHLEIWSTKRCCV